MADEPESPFAEFARKKVAAQPTAGVREESPFAEFAPKHRNPVTGPDTNAPGLWESFGRGAAEGATFGFDDKLGLDKHRREESQKTNPWVHFAGELAGSAVPMTAAMLLPTGATQAAGVARGAQLTARGAGLLRSALVPGEIASVGQSMAQGAKLGSVYGGLSGAGHAKVGEEDSYPDALAKRAESAAKGAVQGAGIGAAFGPLAHGVFRVGQNVGNLLAGARAETAEAGKGALVTATRKLEQDRITPQQVIDGILSEFPSSTTPGGATRFWAGTGQPITREQVEQVVGLAGRNMSPAQINAALGGKGPGEPAIKSLLTELEERHLGPLNLVDRASMVRTGSGDNTQMSLRVAAATPGEHVGIAREGLLERQVGAQGRFTQLFDRMLGSSDFDAVKKKALTDFEDAGARAYGDAFAQERPFNLAPIFSKWEGQFDRMRGVIPDTIRQRLKSMMWEETNAAGQTVRTPPENLQSFMYAREGVGDLMRELPDGNNLKRHLTRFYNEMTDEVAKTNPAWKIANDIWRDGKAGQEALDAGTRMSTRLNNANRENLSVFSDAQKEATKATTNLQKAYDALLGPKAQRAPTAQELAAATPQQRAAIEQAQARLDAASSQQQLFKVGLTRSLMDMLMNQGETHDASRKMLLPGAQKMLREVLGPEADHFFKVVRAEQAMARTYKSQFGSQTTPLALAEKDQNWAPRFEASMANPLTWLNPAFRLMQEHAANSINSRRNTDLMKLYTGTDPIQQLEALRAMQALHQARSDAGNRAGRFAIDLGSGAYPEAKIGSRTSEEPTTESILKRYYKP